MVEMMMIVHLKYSPKMSKYNNTTMPNVGDAVELFDETLHEVVRVDNGLIWYKIKGGLGQTIVSCIKQVIIKSK